MSMFGAILGVPGDTKLVVGLEEEKDGLKVYVGARYLGIHSHLKDFEACTKMRRAWGGPSMGHLFTDIPSDALCDCKEKDQ